MFWDMANHLGRFSGASGPSEGWEQVGGAVGGEAQVEVVKFWLWFWTYHRLEFPSQTKCSLVCEISSVVHSEPQETHIFTALRSLSKVTSKLWKCVSLVALNGPPKRFHRPKNIWFDLEIQVCGMFRTKVRISLLQLGLLLLQPLQPVLSLQMGLRLLKIVPNDLPYPKTWGLTPKSSL